MTSIKVNADYELVLFGKKEAPKVINQSIEFLALYLEELPLFTEKVYTEEFLNHVRKISGRNPIILKEGEWRNWWGDLADLSLESEINSKEFILPFSRESQLVTDLQNLNLDPLVMYLAKSPYGMSGQNFLTFTANDLEKLKAFLEKRGKIIIEPLRSRVHDFSHYVFPGGKSIAYQNLVDEKFQYKGTIFSDLTYPDLRQLNFYEDISSDEWSKFEKIFTEVRSAVLKAGGTGGYSIDSFTYLENNELKIRDVSEVNYRKTMGLMAWLLSMKYFKDMAWSLFVLGKSLQRSDAFSYVEEKLRRFPNLIHLSPGDTRFEAFLIGANSPVEGKEKFEQLRELLPDCQFSIKI